MSDGYLIVLIEHYAQDPVPSCAVSVVCLLRLDAERCSELAEHLIYLTLKVAIIKIIPAGDYKIVRVPCIVQMRLTVLANTQQLVIYRYHHHIRDERGHLCSLRETTIKETQLHCLCIFFSAFCVRHYFIQRINHFAHTKHEIQSRASKEIRKIEVGEPAALRLLVYLYQINGASLSYIRESAGMMKVIAYHSLDY